MAKDCTPLKNAVMMENLTIKSALYRKVIIFFCLALLCYQQISGVLMEPAEMLALLQDTAVGDRASFARLYERASPRVYAVCLKLLQHRELAEEAMQDTFIRVWHNAGEYQSGRGSVLTWITTIARYRSLDMLRRKKVQKEQSLLDEDLMARKDNDRVSDDGLAKRLEHCMAHLSDEQRQAIQLVYFNGLSHGEAVTHFRSPLGTIKSWVRRGLQSLKQCLSL